MSRRCGRNVGRCHFGVGRGRRCDGRLSGLRQLLSTECRSVSRDALLVGGRWRWDVGKWRRQSRAGGATHTWFARQIPRAFSRPCMDRRSVSWTSKRPRTQVSWGQLTRPQPQPRTAGLTALQSTARSRIRHAHRPEPVEGEIGPYLIRVDPCSSVVQPVWCLGSVVARKIRIGFRNARAAPPALPCEAFRVPHHP